MSIAPSHNLRQKTFEIETLGLSRISHPPYIPDISPCDFWLFGFLNENAKRIEDGSSNEVLNALWALLPEIQRSDLIPTYEDGIETLKEVIEIGENISQDNIQRFENYFELIENSQCSGIRTGPVEFAM
jgi:hypothetical protein